MKPVISVIVPVYMVEKYLNRCINSLIGQTFKDYEVVLIDDGSQDNSPKICDEFALNYAFVKVIHKENGGPSEARNCGVKSSVGKYITFIDSDDYISNDYLERLFKLQQEYDADITVAGVKKVTSYKKYNNSKTNTAIAMSGYEALLNMMYQKGIDTSPCAMLLRREITENICFPKKRFHEDDFTTYKYFLNAHTVVLDPKPRYFYLQREDSIMHSEKKAYLDEIDASQNFVDEFAKLDRNLLRAAESKKFSNYCQILLSNRNLKQSDNYNYEIIANWLKSKRMQIIFDNNTRLKNKVAAFALFFGDKGLYLLSKLNR